MRRVRRVCERAGDAGAAEGAAEGVRGGGKGGVQADVHARVVARCAKLEERVALLQPQVAKLKSDYEDATSMQHNETKLKLEKVIEEKTSANTKLRGEIKRMAAAIDTLETRTIAERAASEEANVEATSRHEVALRASARGG